MTRAHQKNKDAFVYIMPAAFSPKQLWLWIPVLAVFLIIFHPEMQLTLSEGISRIPYVLLTSMFLWGLYQKRHWLLKLEEKIDSSRL